MASIAKWYTYTEYYDEDGVKLEMTAKEIKRKYQIISKTKKIEINGNTGKITWWCRCGRKKQITLFEESN